MYERSLYERLDFSLISISTETHAILRLIEVFFLPLSVAFCVVSLVLICVIRAAIVTVIRILFSSRHHRLSQFPLPNLSFLCVESVTEVA